MQALLALWEKQSPFNKFLAKAALFYIIWMVGYDYLISRYFLGFNNFLTLNIAQVGAACLRAINFDAEAISVPNGLGSFWNYIYINKHPYVVIENGCNGLVLMYLYAMFIVAFPGPTKHKYWYIPLGVFLIYWINIGRIVFLSTMLLKYEKNVYEFHHKYTFQLVVYVFIFIFWVIWANRYSKTAEPATT